MEFSTERCGDALDALAAALPRLASGYCVALSGGLDSVVLLHALAALARSRLLIPVRALHVDHGLVGASRSWAAHCIRIARDRGIDCTVLRVDAGAARGESPEAAARSARYAAFAGDLGQDEVLLTAHQADDQLETLLLQLFRGSGLRGLVAMPRSVHFARGWHQRPLLEFERSDLQAWATSERLEWIDDPSNDDASFARNYVRHQVLPVVRNRWPSVARTVGRTARHLAEALALESEFAELDLLAVGEGETLAVDRLVRLSEIRRRAVVRAWLRHRRVPVPSTGTLAALLNAIERAAADRVPVTRWQGAAVYRYRGHLFAVGTTLHSHRTGACHPGEVFDLGAGQALEWRPGRGRGLSQRLTGAVVQVRHRQARERFRAVGSHFERDVSKWLQERSVVPWQRDAIPRLVIGGRIASLGDLAYAEEFAARSDEASWEVVWSGRPPLLAREFLSGGVSGGECST